MKNRMLALGATVVLVGATFITPVHASDNVRVSFAVQACEGCTITASQVPKGGRTWLDRRAVVKNGRAVMTLPAARTSGAIFFLGTPGYASALGSGGGARPIIALGFEGYAPGSTVTRAQTLAQGQRANWCWAGSRSNTTIRVSTYRVKAEGIDGGRVTEIYAWANPTQATFDDARFMQPAGDMGANGDPTCR